MLRFYSLQPLSREDILTFASNKMGVAIKELEPYFSSKPQNPVEHPTLGNLSVLADEIDTLWEDKHNGKYGINLVSHFIRARLEELDKQHDEGSSIKPQ